MKKVIFTGNASLLAMNILLFVCFAVYTVAGSSPFHDFTSSRDIQIQFIIALIFEFAFFAVSKLLSIIIKADLSFKGTDVLKLVPKSVLITVISAASVITLYSVIVKINFEFVIMTVFMAFSILLETGITALFKRQCN